MIYVVDNFLKEYGLNYATKTFLVGFSGGYDSTCLLDNLNILSKKYGFRLVALHLNHNWRGKESLQDEQNCKNFCQSNSIEFVSKTLQKPVKKDENSAREARYDFFREVAKKYSNSVIVTAHTLSDNAETVIYRIAKGTGLKGLQGIQSVREVGGFSVYRPLLTVGRAAIETYCTSKGLVPNVDSSNLDLSYKRNFIRHKVMPLFKEINFNAENSINSLSKLAVSNNKIVDEYLNIIKKDLFFEGKILTEKFRTLSNEVMQKIVYDLFLENEIDYDYKKITEVLEFIKNNFNSKAGSRHSLTSNLWIFACSKYIFLIDKIAGELNSNIIGIKSEGEFELTGSNFVFSVQKFEGKMPDKFPNENSKTAIVDLGCFGFDFELRARRDGDYIVPFGMIGSMKLKKYLNSKGIFQHDKNELVLLCSGSEVLWVVGVGLSDKLRVKNAPTHVLKLLDKYD